MNGSAVRYVYHQDHAHGWIAVSKVELRLLGILDKISRYSYHDDATVYLEEDSDFWVWLKARADRGWERPPIDERFSDGLNPIRKLARMQEATR